MNTQLSFPTIASESDALENLALIEGEAQAIAERYRGTLAKMHAVGSYLAEKKQDISSQSWMTFLAANFPEYEVDYLRRLIRFSIDTPKEEVQNLELNAGGKALQTILALPSPPKEPTLPSAPSISTAANGLSRFLKSAAARYGSLSSAPPGERQQYKTVMRPMVVELVSLYSDDELKEMTS